MNMEEMKWFATLGVGGILAGIMFFFYRQDRSASEKMLFQVMLQQREAFLQVVETQRGDRAASERAMEKLVTDHRAVNIELLEVVKQNTRAVQSLTETVRGAVSRTERTRKARARAA